MNSPVEDYSKSPKRHGLVSLGAGFLLTVGLSASLNILIIPIVIVSVGTSEWSSLAVAQSVAAVASVLVAFGWGVVGPTAVAALPVAERGKFFTESVITRVFLISVVVVPFGTVIGALPTTRDFFLNNLTAGLSILVLSLGGTWFFTGEASPMRLFLFDAIPRILGTAAGTGVLLLTRELGWFVAAQLVGSVVSVVLSAVNIRRRHPRRYVDLSFRGSLSRLRNGLPGVLTVATTALYVNVPIVVVAALAPGGVAIYAIADKLQKFAVLAAGPVTQVAQGYVPNAANRHDQNLRIRRAVRTGAVLSALFGVATFLFLPVVARGLSGSLLDVPYSLSAPMGITVAAIVLSGVTGLACLMAIGKSRDVATSTIIGAIVGVPASAVGALLFGVTGVAFGVAIAELAVVVYQVLVLRFALSARDGVVD